MRRLIRPPPACDSKARRLDCIRILQCLSSFYVEGAEALSIISFQMISEYTNILRTRVAVLMSFLALRGYVALAPDQNAGRLDSVTWEERSYRCSTMRYFAYFVENAPRCMRDKDSLRAVPPGCGAVHVPDSATTGCSLTVASNFNGVFTGYNSELDHCLPLERSPPIEYKFEPTLCLNHMEGPETNLWYLLSAFYQQGGEVLFRRELLVLYSSGTGGRTGMDIVNQGGCILLCMNDEILSDEQAVDLIVSKGAQADCSDDVAADPSHDCQCPSPRTFRTLGGSSVVLDAYYGVAHYAGKSRLYRERGLLRLGTEIIELASADSGNHRPRHDPRCVVDSCRRREEL